MCYDFYGGLGLWRNTDSGSDKMKKKKPGGGIYAQFQSLILAAALLLAFLYAGTRWGVEDEIGPKLMLLVVVSALLFSAILLESIIHETGHFIFGKLTGYRFCSFRVQNFMWVKQDGKLRLKRLSLVGTGGQCLMVPPEMLDGRMPYKLYYLGGVIADLVWALAFLALFFVLEPPAIAAVILLVLSLAGWVNALLNGIPYMSAQLPNDGYEYRELSRDNSALRYLWAQLKVNQLQTEGVRIKDMPPEWFVVQPTEGKANTLASTIEVFACNRLMDRHAFGEASERIDRLLQEDTGLVNLHRNQLLYDRIYCELIGPNRVETLQKRVGQRDEKFDKAMKRHLFVLRTDYAYALLAKGDETAAQGFMAEFDKSARLHPYAGDLESERELLALAQQKYRRARTADGGGTEEPRRADD